MLTSARGGAGRIRSECSSEAADVSARPASCAAAAGRPRPCKGGRADESSGGASTEATSRASCGASAGGPVDPTRDDAKVAARRARDRRYYAARRDRMNRAEDEAAARLLALANAIQEEHRVRRQIELDAALLGGRLEVRDAIVAHLSTRLAAARELDAARSAERSRRLQAIGEALAGRYGDGAASLVAAAERSWPSRAWDDRQLAALDALARLPAPPPARNAGVLQEPMPFEMLTRLTPHGQRWTGWFFCQAGLFYTTEFLLNPDCPMRHVSTMLPRDMERITSDVRLSPDGFGELVRANSDANVLVPEERLRAWLGISRSVLRTLDRFATPAQRLSPEFFATVKTCLVPTMQFLIKRFMARVAGRNRWVFADLAPPAWVTDEEAYDRLVSQLRLSQSQIDHLVSLYDEMVAALRPLCTDIVGATDAILAVGVEEGGPTSASDMLNGIAAAAASSTRLREVVGWYGLLFFYAFSLRQTSIAAVEAKRPILSQELAVPIVIRVKRACAENAGL